MSITNDDMYFQKCKNRNVILGKWVKSFFCKIKKKTQIEQEKFKKKVFIHLDKDRKNRKKKQFLFI